MIKSSSKIKIIDNNEIEANLNFKKFLNVATFKIRVLYKKFYMCDCKCISIKNCFIKVVSKNYFKCKNITIPIKILVQNTETKQLFCFKSYTNKNYVEFCLPLGFYVVWIEFLNKNTDKILLQATSFNSIIFLDYEI